MTFKHGDWVLVTKKVQFESDWQNCWTETMNDYVNDNHLYKVLSVYPSGIYLFGVEEGFPPSSLTLYADKQTKPEDLVKRKIRLLWNQSNWVKQQPQRAY